MRLSRSSRRPGLLGDVTGIGSRPDFIAERPEQELLCLEIATAVASKGDELAGKPCAQGAVVGHAIIDELAVHIIDRPIEGLQRLRAEAAAPGGLGQCRSKGGGGRPAAKCRSEPASFDLFSKPGQ